MWKAKSAVDHFVTLQVLINKVSVGRVKDRVLSLDACRCATYHRGTIYGEPWELELSMTLTL